jgi:hypothetical protein
MKSPPYNSAPAIDIAAGRADHHVSDGPRRSPRIYAPDWRGS